MSNYLERAERKLIKKFIFDTCSRHNPRDLWFVQLLWPYITNSARRRLARCLGEFCANKTYHIDLQDGFSLEIRPCDALQCRIALYGSKYCHVWEPKTAELLGKLLKGGGSCIIAGGHVGYYPLLASTVLRSKPGIVYAFEPNDDQNQVLIRNVQLNGRGNVVVERIALYSDNTVIQFRKDTSNLQSAVVAQFSEGGVSVVATSIDHYVASREISDLALIMLDIEGAEHEALAGATKALNADSRVAAQLIFELVPDRRRRCEQEELLRHLRSVGYSVFVIEDPYDYIVHRPCLSGIVKLHPVQSIAEVDDARVRLGLADPNCFATKRVDELFWDGHAVAFL